MAATVSTKEEFPKASTPQERINEEKRLRIKAGAIRARIEDGGEVWTLITEWNVIGED
jgi:hypothetical protein